MTIKTLVKPITDWQAKITRERIERAWAIAEDVTRAAHAETGDRMRRRALARDARNAWHECVMICFRAGDTMTMERAARRFRDCDAWGMRFPC